MRIGNINNIYINNNLLYSSIKSGKIMDRKDYHFLHLPEEQKNAVLDMFTVITYREALYEKWPFCLCISILKAVADPENNRLESDTDKMDILEETAYTYLAPFCKDFDNEPMIKNLNGTIHPMEMLEYYEYCHNLKRAVEILRELYNSSISVKQSEKK